MEKGLTVRTKRSSLLRLFQASGDFIPRCASLRADLRSRLILKKNRARLLGALPDRVRSCSVHCA